MAKKTKEELQDTLARRAIAEAPDPAKFLSSGSTLLNIAASGTPRGCYMHGGYYFFVGDSSSGKTFLALTMLAEAKRSKHYRKHRIILDDVEGGALMDIRKFFGEEVADRLEPPRGTRSNPENSYYIEDFYDGLHDIIDEGKPFIYVLDSQDALSSRAEEKKEKEQKKARSRGTDESGSYGDGKAKIHSQRLRKVVGKLRDTGSILLILGQTRDNIGFGAQFTPKIYSGGRALMFYANLSIWSSVLKHIKKDVKGKQRELGIVSRVRTKKNRASGRDRTVDVPIYHSYGVDDVGSCIDYLVDEKHWSKNKQGVIIADEFDQTLPRDKLIAWVEEEDNEVELRKLVGKVWNEIEAACALPRKKRYE